MSTEIEVYQNMPGFEPEQKEMLSEPLTATVIEHRPGGGGRSLAYITGKTAIDTANRIFGFGKWGYRVVARSCEKSVNLDGTITGIFYTADIELYVVGCPFPFPGEGVGIVVPTKAGIVPECHEKARKEAVTDALKRALRHYGDQFGLALYDEDAYVDAGNGTLVQVKNVKSGTSHQPQGTRTVDASQPAVSKEAAMRLINPLKVKARKAGFIAGSSDAELIKAWHEAKRAVFLREVTDAEMIGSEDLRVQMRDAIDRHVQLNQSEQKAS